jgi:hypothetical protein
MAKKQVSPKYSLRGYSAVVALLNNVKNVEFAKSVLGVGLAFLIAWLSGIAAPAELWKAALLAVIGIFAKTYGIDLVHFYTKEVKL